MLHAFDAGAFGVGLVEEEVRDDRLDADPDSACFSGESGAEGGFAGKVNDVAGGSSVLKESGEAAGAFGFDGFGPRGFVPFRSGLALRDQMRLQASDELSILAMSSGDYAELLRES